MLGPGGEGKHVPGLLQSDPQALFRLSAKVQDENVDLVGEPGDTQDFRLQRPQLLAQPIEQARDCTMGTRGKNNATQAQQRSWEHKESDRGTYRKADPQQDSRQIAHTMPVQRQLPQHKSEIRSGNGCLTIGAGEAIFSTKLVEGILCMQTVSRAAFLFVVDVPQQ